MSKNIEIFNTVPKFNQIKQRANKMLQDGLIRSVEDTHDGILVECFSDTDKKYIEEDFKVMN